ncbi:hypothetical protein DTO166G4_371 [Paecilomyces variotii]|nr:hypothetical protein DTO166G4_371 [Paecilomyces variotii]KAJ9237246.1 hypothetical protein DTO166G5_3642 [Paecilomyces variotii]
MAGRRAPFDDECDKQRLISGMLGGWSLVVARSAEALAGGEEREERPRRGEAQWPGPNAPYNEGSRWGSALKPWTDELGMEGGCRDKFRPGRMNLAVLSLCL